MPVQKTEDLRVGTKINTGRACVDIFGKNGFPISPETENFHWLKGDKCHSL